MTSIVLFTNDLRLTDNPALAAAIAYGPVVPTFVFDQDAHSAWPPGPASRAWLACSLNALAEGLEARGAWLVVRVGEAADKLVALARETGARAVHVSAAVEPDGAASRTRVAATLAQAGIRMVQHPPNLLHEPGTLTTAEGRPYQVFTPFFRTLERRVLPALRPPVPAPERIVVPQARPRSEQLPQPATDPPSQMLQTFTPGEAGALARAHAFLDEAVAAYETMRDVPAVDATSRLSPHLAFGEISVRALVTDVLRLAEAEPAATEAAHAFVRQLAWREFAYHLLAAFPDTPTAPLKPVFTRFPWRYDERGAQAWREGTTGFPLVDAGMRQLAGTGWMHNRVRMVVASFLTKDLLTPWLDGARWFWEQLADADLANNTLGWQWVAGCGADAQPFFRVFDPVKQSRRYDPRGTYIRRWVPELARMPDRWIHAPWEAPESELASCGVRLGKTYPLPLIDHAIARVRALEAYAAMRAEAR